MSDTEHTHLDADAIAELTYEQAVERLEALVDRIESGSVGLEQTVQAYEEGVALRAHCEALLSRAEQRVRTLSEAIADPDAKPYTKPERDPDA